MQAGYAAADAKAAEDGAERVDVVQAAMASLVHVLSEAGCLVEPAPPKPAMTVQEAAVLLCELSRHPRLSDPEDDYALLLKRPDMVDFAWAQSLARSIPPAQLNDAHEARRLLLDHHRRAAAG